MAMSKWQMVAGMGIATTIIQTLVAEIKKAGGQEDDVHRLATPDASDVWKEIAQVIVKKEQELVESVNDIYKIIVYYKDNYYTRGGWDRVDDVINRPSWEGGGTWKHELSETDSEKGVEVVFRLFPNRGQDTVSDDMIRIMDKEGYRPAILQELLAFGASEKTLQRRYAIAALGSTLTLRGQPPQVACLDGSNASRSVLLHKFHEKWYERRTYFLGVAKSTKAIRILVLGKELEEWQKRDLQDLFPGERTEFVFGDVTDDVNYRHYCDSLKPDLIVFPERFSVFAMNASIPHVVVTKKEWSAPTQILELSPIKPEFKPFVPKPK